MLHSEDGKKALNQAVNSVPYFRMKIASRKMLLL